MAILSGPEHRIDSVNPAYRRLIGYRDILGKTVAEALTDVVEHGCLSILDDVFVSGQTFCAYGAKYAVPIEPGGQIFNRYVDFVFQPIRDDDGKTKGIFVEGIDVTERFIA